MMAFCKTKVNKQLGEAGKWKGRGEGLGDGAAVQSQLTKEKVQGTAST